MKRFDIFENILDDKIVALEFLDFFLGKSLGWGESRHVFVNHFNPKLVVKFDMSVNNANVEEHKVWQQVKNTKLAKWFAPVHSMSSCGRILLMRRCEPLTPQMCPKKVPVFFNDLKVSNWGLLNGKPVCVDYERNNLTEYGLNVSSLKTANW